MKQLEDYIHFASSENSINGMRVIVIPNADVAQRLTNFHVKKERNCTRIQLVDCIFENETFLPMPDVIFSRLTEKMGQARKLTIITGLHGYLLLLNNEQRTLAFAKLKSIVDNAKENFIVLIPAFWGAELRKMFSHPGYEPGKQLVYLEGSVEARNFDIILVDNRWIDVQPPDCNSFRQYLETIDDFPSHADDKIVVALPDNDRKIAGLNDAVKQVHSLADCMRQFYGVEENLSDDVLQWILNTSRQLNAKNALAALRTVFYEDDFRDILQTAPKKIIDERDNVKRSALLWLLKHIVKKESYLHTVLSEPDMNSETFSEFYVTRTAIRLLKDKNAELFAGERKAAIKEIGERANADIRQFISQAKEKPLSQLSIWLNNDSVAEHEEFIRRFDESPKDAMSAYPKLNAYLADYEYGTERLTNYFKRYRGLKLRNFSDESFCQESFDIPFSDFPSRDSELSNYAQDNKTALLVVDAMGAEYLPLIVSLSSSYSLKIEKHYAVLSHYPTSTEFNRIECLCDKLPEIKALDTIVHEGAAKHQTCEYYENIAKILDDVFPKIFDAIAQSMRRFDRVILTADHGASRLAVLAHECGFSKTLNNPADEKPDDWRYIKTPQSKPCPTEFIETLSGNYWVVRGYNRLPKQGGKQYELHGGYTPEECLVPFVVFSKSTMIPTRQIQLEPAKQLVEKDDFDI